MKPTTDYDAIIIGAGPAGSTCGALLAEKGRRVLIIEKEKFPRYHVGESLIPYCFETLNRLGVVDQLNAGPFQVKRSVQFVSPNGTLSAPFYFGEHLDNHPRSQTWQVERGQFDLLLLDNARRRGAEVMEETTARKLVEEDGRVVGVRVQTRDGLPRELRARIVIDASGRDTFAVNQYDWRVPDPKLKKISIWTYYRGAKRDPGIDEGATTVAYVPQRGWFWYLPLHGDVVSLGIVAERDYLYRGPRDPKAIMDREIQENVWIADHLSQGEQFGQYWVTGDYSYRSRYCAKDGLLLTGDAFAFLDPVFSSGVFLALRGGEFAADTVDAALRDGDVSAARFEDYCNTIRTGLEGMRQLVYAFYDEDFSFRDVIRKYPDMRGPLTDCLIGDVFRDLSHLFTCLREFADLPDALPYGRPMQGETAAVRA